MEFEFVGKRIFKYALEFGLVIVFLAIVIFFLSTNAQAVVIVDQAGGGDYLTIQEGIDNAIPGENVFVWDGTYNENITIDKSLQLIGNGSATTVIDGFGTMNNIINVTAEDVEITGFNITESGSWSGIWANVWGFNIHHNKFYLVNFAIILQNFQLNSGSTTVGDIIIEDNDIEGNRGFYLQTRFEQNLPGADLTFGQTIIKNNSLNTNLRGIEIDTLMIKDMDGGSITCGDILINDNTVNVSNGFGVFFWGHLSNLTDVSLDLGRIEVNGNNITAQSTGIYIDWWDFEYLYGTTTASADGAYMNNNNITSDNRGIHLQNDNVYYHYDSSSVSTGDFFIYNNNLTTTGANNEGVNIGLSDFGSYLYNDSSVYVGQFFIEMNSIYSTGNSINFNVGQCGAYMYDNAQAWYGNFHVTNNNVTSTGVLGIDLNWHHVGYNQYDNSRVMMGEVHVEDNDVYKTGGAGFALEVTLDTVCNEMYGDSFLSFDDWHIERNTVTSSERGIEVGRYTSFYQMYDNSWVVYHDFYVRDNVVDSDQLCMYIYNYECGYEIEDFSRVIVGNLSVTGNNVSSPNGYGIHFEFYEIGYYMYDQSHAEFGWSDISYNNFSSDTNYGGYVDIYNLGAYMYGNSQVYIGDITIKNNEFWAPNENGLYLYEFWQNAYEMYDSSYVRIGNILVNDNYINSGDDGIYMETWTYNAYNMYQSASADFGNFEFNRNIIECVNHGMNIYFEYMATYLYWDNHVTMGHWQFNDNHINTTSNSGLYFGLWAEVGTYLYGTSTFSMGNFEALRNTINSNDDGIYASMYNLAYDLYGSSQCYFGDFLFNENTINATGDGIYFSEFDYVACNMYGSSYAEFGNFEVNNNDIIAGYGSALGYDGIYGYFYDIGYNMQGNSEAHFGHLQINDNTITCHDEDGIYIWHFNEIASEMYDNSYFGMGNVEVCGNWVDAGGVGIHLEYIQNLGYTNYDKSQAHFGNFLFNENNITSGDHGIFGEYLYYWGSELDNSADAYFGNVEFNNNTVNASSSGIIIGESGLGQGINFWGAFLGSSSEVKLGHVQINDNDVLATGGNGIQLWQLLQVGAWMRHDAYFEMSNFEMCRNVIDASEHGLYIEDFANNAQGLGIDMAVEYPGLTTFIIGDILFNDNVIVSDLNGMALNNFNYLANDMYGDSYAEFGNFEFNRNHITSSGGTGIYINGLYEWAYTVYDNSEAVFGQIQVNDNNITAGNETLTYDGIYLGSLFEFGSYMYDTSRLTIGNLEMCRNVIAAGGDGIDIGNIEFLAYQFYGSSECHFGDFLWNDNIITAGINPGDGYGITIDAIRSVAYELYDQSDAYYGSFEFNRNTIHSWDDGIHVYNEYWGYSLYGANEMVFGHYQINDNTINATDGRGIDMNYFNQIGYAMEGTSIFWMDNLEICRNNITAGNETYTGNFGIYMEIQQLAYNNEDSAWCHFGDFLFNDNVIVASQYGIFIVYIEYLASYFANSNPAGYCYAEFGNFEFNRNTITSLDDGIYVSDWEYWGYEMYHESEAHFGHIQFNDNSIHAGNDTIFGDGIYFSDGPAYDFAAGLYGNSYATFENIEICRNTVNATDYGLYVDGYQYLGYDMHDSSRAAFQDFIVSENNIISGDIGMDIFNFDYVGIDMYDESSLTIGDFLINDNVIEAGLLGFGEGIYLDDMGYNGYEMHQNAYAEFGSFEVCRNWIDSPGYGIFINPYEWGAYMYDQSVFMMGDWLINNNTVVSSGDDGIYFNSYNFGYENSDTSRAYFGINEIMHNTVNSTGGDGLYAWWWFGFGNKLYDYAYIEVGSCYIMFNDITSWSSTDRGIYTGPYSSGYYVYDEAQVYFGDYIVSDNTLFSNGTIGIYFYYEEVGYNLDISSLPECRAVADVGEVRIERNMITVPKAEGLYFEGYDVAENLNNYASVTTEGIFINDNTITAFDYGIYFEMQYFGYNLWDESQALLGPVFIDNNDITCTNGTGIYYYIVDTAYLIYNDAQSSIDDIRITQNTITAGTTGIDIVLERCINIFDNSMIVFPGMNITDNRVYPGFSALNYTTIDIPVGVTGTPTLSTGDVVISDNTFDSGLFGMYFEWMNPDPTVPQPIFRLDYNYVYDGWTNATGLYMMNITDVYIESLEIDAIDNGIYVNNSNIWLMFNSTITNVMYYHLNLTSTSFIGAVNCTFNQASVYYEDDVSELKIGWFMNVLVITQAGYGVPGAHVVVGDVYGTITFDGNANTLGEAFYRIAWEYLENITGIIDTYNNHTADADKDGVFGFAVPDPLMDQTKLVIIILGDSVPPNILGDLSDTFGTTGDPFNFSLEASDNFGIYRVHVNYRFGTSGPFNNMTLTGTGPFDLSIILPSGYVGTMQYYFSVQDVGDNWVSTGITSLSITDNDAPVINADNSDTTATTGDIFNFIVDATDNVDVTEARVVWWFDANPQTDDIMNGAGPYDFNVTVPPDSLDDLHYYFRIRDAAGNWIIGTQVNVTVTDNDAPTINADNSDITATTGEQFYFDADITDNIGMNATYLYYWFGIDAPTIIFLNGSGPNTYNISVPADSLEILHYYFTAVDDAGNWLLGPQVNITVVDNDAPTGIDDTSDIVATTDDSFTFEVNATDNIGISDAYVIYWFGTDAPTNTSMTGTGPYDHQITIPLDSLDTLHYYFAITDADGNWLVGPQVDITVVDDDAPTIVTDDSDTTADAGQSFFFQVNATDNIGVTEAYVIYWYDSGPETRATMIGAFNRTIIIAPDATTLHYYFAVSDAAGNWGYGSQVDVDVTGAIIPDDEAPTLDSDDSDTDATTGDSFEFDVTFNDNIGVTEIHVVYWFDDDTPIDTIITGTYVITVPPDSLDTLHYYFTAEDAAGNEYIGTQVDIDVMDNDLPYNLMDDSDTTAATGETFTFNGDAEDNIGVTSAEVVYWFDSGAQTTTPMTGTDPFTLDITIPSTAGVLHYYLVFYDAEGNTASTQTKDITIMDDEPGSLSNDASDTSGRQGQPFRFQVDASDNIGVSKVYAIYWFGDDDSRKVLLPLAGADGTYSGSFISREHGTLHYYFLVVDGQGNEFEGEEKTVTIEAAEISPGEKEGEGEAGIFPWILVVILVIVVLLLLFLLMRKKGEEPEAIPAESEEGVEAEGEFGEEGLEEGLDEEPGEELEEEEPGEMYEEDLEAEGGPAIPEEEEGFEEPEGERFEDLEKVPGVEEGGEVETGKISEEEMVGEEEVVEEEPEEAITEEEAGEGADEGMITCPNCGIQSSADTEECPICRTKFH